MIIFPIGFFKQEVSMPKRVRVTFASSPSSVTLTKCQLRYNKAFAYSWSMDDSLEDASLVTRPLFAGGNATYEDGIDLNLPGLYYTDGCGNKIAFDGAMMLVGSWIITGSTNNHYICTTDLKKMYTYNWGFFNHSYSHKDYTGLTNADLYAEIENNYNIVKSYTGIRMNYFSAPSNFPPYSGVSSTFVPDKISLGTTDQPYFNGASVESLLASNDFARTRTIIQDSNISRTSGDTYRISQYSSGSTSSIHPWIHEATHRMELGEASGSLSANLRYMTAKNYFTRIAATYGSGGTDSIWFANFQDIYEYLRSYQNVTYTTEQSGNTVDFTFNFTNVDSDFRNHSLSFNISGNTTISAITYSNFDTTSHSITGSTALININYKPKYEKSAFNMLDADVKVTNFEAIKTSTYQTIAQTAVDLLLNGAYKTGLQTRINNVIVIPDSRTFQIDLGSNVTSRPSAAPWNNIDASNNAFIATGTTVSGLTDTTSQSSLLSLIITNGYCVSGTTGTTIGVSNWQVEDGNSTTTGITYPQTAYRDCFRVQYPSGGTMEIRGCDDAKFYAINILSSRTSIGYTCTFNVQGTQKTINPKNNSAILSWTGITSVSGVITISAVSSNQGASQSFAYINIIDIIETLV